MGVPIRSAVNWLLGRPYLLLTLTSLAWASNAVAGRLAVGRVSPMALVSLRWLFVLAVLALFSGRRIRTDLPALWPHRRWLLLMGGLGYTAFNSLYYVAAHHTSAVNLGIIQSVMPAMVLLGGLVVFGTRIRLVQGFGLILTLAGAVVVTCQGDWHVLRSFSVNAGDVLVFGATVLYAGYATMLVKRPPLAGISIFTGFALAAFLTSLPLLVGEWAVGQTLWPDLPGWAIVLYIAVAPSLVSQLFFMRSIELIGPGRAGMFVNLVPVLAALLGVLVLGERFEAFHGVALVMVLGGIWIAERGRGGGETPIKVSES